MARSNRCVGRWYTAILVLALAGSSGQTAPDKPAQPSRPASLQEAANVIDLRKFPTLEHTEVSFQTATKVGYTLAKPALADALQFYRGKLEEAGWKIEREDINQEYQFGELVGSKDGFTISVNVTKDPNSEKRTMSIYNQGNVDARSLPQLPGAEAGQSDFDSAGYRVEADYDAIAKFVRAELQKLGWREYVGYGGRQERIPGETDFLWFVQRGMHLHVVVDQVEGKSEVRYHVGMNDMELPIMPEVYGDVEYMDEPFVNLLYATRAQPAQVLEFYRKELTALGWSIGAEGKGQEGGVKLDLEDPNKKGLYLEVLAKDPLTYVHLASAEMG